MSSIIVTGGAGYIGSHTVVELVNAGFEPLIVDNFSNSEPSVLEGIEKIIARKVQLIEGDCTNPDFMDQLFATNKDVEAVIHFAAFKSVSESVEQPLKYFQNNLNSLMVLLDKMKSHNVNDLVFSSSCTVYGQPDVLPVTEDSPFQPAASPYGRTKQLSEEIIETLCGISDIRAVSLRYFNPIGAHPSSLIGELPIGVPTNLVPFLTQTVAGWRNQLVVHGDDYSTSDGTCIRDYIHVVDLAKAHVKALEYLRSKPKPAYLAFNVGTGHGVSVLEVINTFEEATAQKVQFIVGPKRSGDIEKIWASASRAEKELGWRSEITLEEALKDAWNWQSTLPDPS